MKFLLDVGITPALGRLLEADGHTFRYLPDFYSNKTSDAHILDIARQNGEVVITHDLDFGTLFAFSGQRKPSVILFRLHHISALEIFNKINPKEAAVFLGRLAELNKQYPTLSGEKYLREKSKIDAGLLALLGALQKK